MPRLITREEALASIVADGGRPACLMCAIRDGRVGDLHTIFEDDDTLVLLPRYVTRWGQVMAMPKVHVTSFAEVDSALWARVSALALRAARVTERLMRPRRCYVASTGSSAGELTQSSEHLHIHVIPLHDAADKPSEIFTWSGGVYVAERPEWEALRCAFVEEWALVGS